MNNPISFHDKISLRFNDNYYKKRIFKERYAFLTNKCENLFKNNSKKNIKILDYGCGSGIFSIHLSNYGSVTAVDGSKSMIELAKSNTKSNKNIKFKLLDLNSFKTKEKFELIFCSSVMEYFENFQEHMEKLNNLLTPKGTLLLSMPNSKGIYRLFERIMFNVIKKPDYYSHVKTNKNEDYYKKVLTKEKFSISEINYFSVNLKFLNYLPIRSEYKCNMILFILNKKT